MLIHHWLSMLARCNADRLPDYRANMNASASGNAVQDGSDILPAFATPKCIRLVHQFNPDQRLPE